MFSKKKNDLLFRKKFFIKEKQRIIFSFFQKKILTAKLSKNFKFLLSYKLYLNSKFFKTKIVRRCILTNRNRGVFRPYNISRIILREMLQCAIIPGYSKAVW
ncbi:MAG: Ribosomal protein S14p/S29e [Bacteroidota bacterium]|jgi:ribosomal protein S14